jgi:hypothetical protein
MPEHIRQFLLSLGVADQPHSGRTFLEHLEGTYALLQEHGEEIALAGALHSIYGTQFYTPRKQPTREQVRELVGDKAERLAWLFCSLPRSMIKNRPPCLPEAEREALFLIYEANRKEQRHGK